MVLSIIRKCAAIGAAVAIVFGAGTPASAGGGFGYYGGGGYYGGVHYAGFRHYGYGRGYYGRGYGRGYYGGGYRRGFHHGRRYRRGGGGRAAAIALGVVGGAIILNELAEDRARRRYYDGRYYDRRPGGYYDPAEARAQPLDTGNAGSETLPAESYGGAGEEADIDERLDGGPEPIRLSFSGAAYSTCVDHARQALADRNFILAAPARPDTADDIGGAWKMTANVSAQNQQGEQWTRAMYCEADDSRVYLLELI
ncbi:Uncharacterized protein SCF082_LOCUS24157 [Durusdinium trenchii]|uniref:Secreted protein n=1 Tax=Durusdinium trenchii TaxID=1381693 RepID=A0ABP0LT53_9DINO